MIYFVQSPEGGPVKIGYSARASLRGRLKELQACSPVPLVAVAVLKGGYPEESKWHTHFAKDRLHGEWFTPTPELAEAINAGLVFEGRIVLEGKPLKLIAAMKPAPYRKVKRNLTHLFYSPEEKAIWQARERTRRERLKQRERERVAEREYIELMHEGPLSVSQCIEGQHREGTGR